MKKDSIAISKLGRVVTGKTPSTKNAAFFDGEYAFVTPSDLNWRTYYCRSTERTVTEDARKSHRNQFVPANSVMVTCIGNTIGKCAISAEDCLTNQQINTIIPKDGLDSQFIYYLLVHNTERIRGFGLGGGSATPILNKTSFSKIKLFVPPATTWPEIARILSAYDDLIENNRRRIQLLEQAARLLYKEWFVHLRFPGHEHTKIIEGVPEGWEQRILEDLCIDVRYGYTASANKHVVGPKFLRITDIVPEMIDWGYVPYCEIDEPNLKRFLLHEGDIVVARTGATVGYAKRIGVLAPMAVFASYLVRFRFGPHYDDMLAGIFMESDYYKAYVRSNVGGAAQPNANARILGGAAVLVPPLALQRIFRENVEPIFTQRNTLQEQNRKLSKARDLLLPKLMDGEVAV